MRALSYSEISTALTCFARWDFSYGGRLAGATLKMRETAPILSDGRAWGAAVASYHSQEVISPWEVMTDSLYDDAMVMRSRGFTPDPEKLVEQQDNLGAILAHYMATEPRLPSLTRLEDELLMPIPSRSGRGRSTRYRLLTKIDGWTEDKGHPWIVEFKLRGKITPLEIVEKAPQYRWYAWSMREWLGYDTPIGVYVDERLKEAPRPARLVKASAKDVRCPVCEAAPESPCVTVLADPKPMRGYHDERKEQMTVSAAVDQVTTPELYEEACFDHKAFVDNGVLAALKARVWQKRHPLIFTPQELNEAGRELISAAQVIRDLDNGRLYPIRNGSPMNCNGCRFKSICQEPDNALMVNSLFERTVPKREREAIPA